MPSLLDPYYPSQCQLCEFYPHNPHLRCTLHPLGLELEDCLDFVAIAPEGEGLGTAQTSEVEEQWQPEGAAYNGELVLQTRRHTLTEQLALLDTHPLFTGRCSACEMLIGSTHPVQVHWDCSNCGWGNDSV
ncbi:hypothetical protein NDI45_28950 [Leptolyngbya sp. GB1-A1]|uniref:hypothetical protein n=1 Tax=Leptolyngbya sp. GB1-A1 TaxID=2933908 RepID=UPI0032992FBA